LNNKIINDPVFGFIRIPKGLLYDLVSHPTLFRLSRIKQLGLANMVFPGAQHTRFQHSIGAYHLMTLAIRTLERKGIFIFDSEKEAVCAAILLHDIGHGPFSHVLENTLIKGLTHEDISLMMMKKLNKEFHGALSLAIEIFEDKYPKTFLHQLLSSQLDVDRLDYLRRDSFFTGVSEGNIGSSRIIDMFNVVNDDLVVEQKGIYSIENYLVSRRLMYWQVYLHKTAIAAEQVLINALNRAKYLATHGQSLFTTPSLHDFIYKDITSNDFIYQPDILEKYIMLDDYDIWSCLKAWAGNPDIILSTLSNNMLNRNIFKVEVSDTPFSEEYIQQKKDELRKKLSLNEMEIEYFFANNEFGKDMYDITDNKIEILTKDGNIVDISQLSDMLNIETLSKHVRKYFFCYHRTK